MKPDKESQFTNVSHLTTADGSDTLHSQEYGETYHSRYGAVTEAEQVFLHGSAVSERLRRRQPTRILEVGFGAGLNFLVTARVSLRTTTPLHYVALEKTLLSHTALAQLNYRTLAPDLWPAFLGWRASLPEPAPETTLRWDFDESNRLEIILGQALAVPIPSLDYHAIYHDAFSPKANPELWTAEFFARLYKRLAEGGKLATYSVKGAVRRNLRAVGFQVEKRPGPPGKREVLVATRPGPATQ